MHRPSPQALLAAVERLATAEGLLALLDAAGDWVDLGLLQALALWIRDPAHDMLHLAHARGLGPSLCDWRPGPRATGSVVWRALQAPSPIPVEVVDLPLGLAVPLRDTDAEAFTLHPLREPDGTPFAVALAGGDSEGLPWDTLGRALHRACVSDRHRWRSAWFDALLPMLDDGVIVAGPDGELHCYSPSLQRMVGWSEEQVRNEGWLPLVYPGPAEREAASGAITALFMGQPSRGTVRRLTTSSGETVDAAVYSAVVPHPSGASPALLGVMRDVTEARRASRQRARDDTLTRLGRMAGGVAHEFNNLLGAIMGHAELVALSPDATDEHRRRAHMVVAAAQRGSVLSRQLLAFSGSSVARIVPVEVGRLIDELVELYRPTMPDHLALEVDRSECVCAVEADPAHLQQALMNLLVNAGEAATSRIGVHLADRPRPAACRFVSTEAPPAGTSMCCISVWDDGTGFSEDALSNLFEPFWTGKAGGHGLGLAAVRGIVGMHGGAIDVGTGPEGTGARVALYLPTSDRPELALPRLAASRHPSRGEVWLIDDELALLEFAAIALRTSGFHVRAFSRGAEAVEAAEALGAGEGPDALVVDVVMPDLDGPSTVAALRARGVDAELLWTSGYSPESAEVPDEGRFLQKPFTGTELRRALDQLLEAG